MVSTSATAPALGKPSERRRGASKPGRAEEPGVMRSAGRQVGGDAVGSGRAIGPTGRDN